MRFYHSFFFRLLVGLAWVCILPAVLLPEWRAFHNHFTTLHQVSMGFVALAFIGSMFSVQRFDLLPGARSWFASIPILGGWYLIFGAVLFVLRLPYSLTYLALGFFLALFFFLQQSIWLKKARILHIGYVPIGRINKMEPIEGVEWIELQQPETEVQGKKIDGIVADLHAVALTDAWQKFFADCSLQHLPVYNIRQIEESLMGRVKIKHMYENNLGSLLPSQEYMVIKQIWDILMIAVSLPVTLPVMLVTAILIKLEDGGPVFYNQERVGYRGKSFKMYKFRSMTANAGLNQQQITQVGDSRITRVGKTIRKWRIDELPQFLNVLMGQMSLIGPRAEYKKFADELEKQVPFYQYRHIVKPGITGWAQVMYGYATGADETQIKIEHDFYYIKNFSFWLDLLIVFKTFKTMLTGFGSR